MLDSNNVSRAIVASQLLVKLQFPSSQLSGSVSINRNRSYELPNCLLHEGHEFANVVFAGIKGGHESHF